MGRYQYANLFHLLLDVGNKSFYIGVKPLPLHALLPKLVSYLIALQLCRYLFLLEHLDFLKDCLRIVHVDDAGLVVFQIVLHCPEFLHHIIKGD